MKLRIIYGGWADGLPLDHQIDEYLKEFITISIKSLYKYIVKTMLKYFSMAMHFIHIAKSIINQ